MIGVAAGSALFLPFNRLLVANRSATRISLVRYTYVSISIAIAIAVVLAVAAVLVVAILTIARPLLFASVDSAVAAAAGVPVRALGALFLALVGATAAEASQIVGALLLFGLLAAPAAAARRFTDDPWRALWLAATLATASVWAGIVISYAAPTLPPSFTIMTVAAALYAGSFVRRTSTTADNVAVPASVM